MSGRDSNGTGTNGTVPIDNRRRIAENWLGALAALAAFEGAFFGGGASAGLTQNLYLIDFGGPARRTPRASPFEFNAFRDNALPSEGTTAAAMRAARLTGP